jgi:L-2-hydroxyglutarate oxidase
MCRRGSESLREYCADRNISYDECGKLVIASGNSEIEALNRIHDRAEQNRVVGLRRVGPEEIRDIEPHATGIAGLYSPRTAITDFSAIARSFAEDVVAAGGRLLLGNPVKEISRLSHGVALRIGDDELVFDRVVICAGLQSDSVAKLVGDEAEPAIVPFRGEYYQLIPSMSDLVRGLIYPMPDANYPFLGVYFTRRDLSTKDLWETLRWPGFQKMAQKHWKMGVSEMIGSGVRAQAVDRDGTLVEDFRIHRLGNVLAVRNAPSPGATSSMAIAEYICDELFKDDR